MVKEKIKNTNSPYIEKEIKKIKLNNNSRVLDVGCGIGQYIPLYKGKITGIDFDKRNLIRAKKRFPKARFIQYDLNKNTLPVSEKFDLIICLDVVEHLEIKQALKLIKNLENLNGGYLFISTPNINNFTTLLRFLMFRTVEIAGKPNFMEKSIYFVLHRKFPPKKNKYFIMESGDEFSNEELHYHVSGFNSGYFRKRGYRVVGGLGFVIYQMIKNKNLRMILDKLYFHMPYFSGSFLAIRKNEEL